MLKNLLRHSKEHYVQPGPSFSVEHITPLNRLRNGDPGAIKAEHRAIRELLETHGYEYTPWSEEDIAHVEKTLGLKINESVHRFLRQVGRVYGGYLTVYSPKSLVTGSHVLEKGVGRDWEKSYLPLFEFTLATRSDVEDRGPLWVVGVWDTKVGKVNLMAFPFETTDMSAVEGLLDDITAQLQHVSRDVNMSVRYLVMRLSGRYQFTAEN